MNADWSLGLTAAIAGFFLKTTLAFVLCVALSRLVDAAKLRFIVWSSFVYGTAAYWLYLAIACWAPQKQPATVTRAALETTSSSFASWQIPLSWSSPLSLSLRIMGSLYLLTLCYFIFNHLRNRRHLKWVLRFSSEPPAEIADTFRSMTRELQAGHSQLLLLSGATSPATFGWLRPIVLLPSSCVEEDRLELEDILRHELHHVRRRDAVWNEIAVAARGLLFFHPAIWYAVRKMQFDRELACDLAVVSRSPDRRAAYAECLVRFAKLNVVPEHGGWGIDFAASAHHLTIRVRSILAASKSSPNWVRCLRVASGVVIAALYFGVAPSLAVLLSFAHQPVSNRLFTPVVQPPSGGPANASRIGRRGHSVASLAKGHEPAVSGEGANLQEGNRPDADFETDTLSTTSSSTTSSGPQLLHRGDPSAGASKGATSQTIALTDTDANGQPVKSGDGKQTVQQTATAALGIYKRLSAIDRH